MQVHSFWWQLNAPDAASMALHGISYTLQGQCCIPELWACPSNDGQHHTYYGMSIRMCCAITASLMHHSPDCTLITAYLTLLPPQYNKLDHNLAAFVHVIGVPSSGALQDGSLSIQSSDRTNPTDAAASGFYIPNPNNAITNNAGGWSGGVDGWVGGWAPCLVAGPGLFCNHHGPWPVQATVSELRMLKLAVALVSPLLLELVAAWSLLSAML